MVRLELDAGIRSLARQSLDEPGGLHGAVGPVEDRAVKVGTQMRELVAPLDREAVLAQSFVFRLDLVALLDVCR